MRKIDRVGNLYGKLVVVDQVTINGLLYCICDCGCGNRGVKMRADNINNSTSCNRRGCNTEDISGRKYNYLTAIEDTGKRHGRKVVWLWRCDCGNTKEVVRYSVTSGKTKSCGCHRKTTVDSKTYVRVLADYKRKYNLSEEQVRAMQDSQLGMCKCCYGSLENFHVDHNHLGGDVRGLLCRGCNIALGLIKDNTEVLENMIKYLNNV